LTSGIDFADAPALCGYLDDVSVYRRVGERYADACVIQRQSFGGGSVMAWGGITAHGRTPSVVVAGNLTGIRYRDKIVQPYVIPFIPTH
jgi:hypothetical protein